jgi:hypothetical protein
VIESLGASPAQIVVERAQYWNANGVSWAAGTKRARDEAAVNSY